MSRDTGSKRVVERYLDAFVAGQVEVHPEQLGPGREAFVRDLALLLDAPLRKGSERN